MNKRFDLRHLMKNKYLESQIILLIKLKRHWLLKKKNEWIWNVSVRRILYLEESPEKLILYSKLFLWSFPLKNSNYLQLFSGRITATIIVSSSIIHWLAIIDSDSYNLGEQMPHANTIKDV